MFALFLSGATLGFSAAVSPGPFQAYLLSHTMQHGLRRTVPSAFAPLISDGPIILIVLVALTQAPPWLLRGLQIAGGVFLVYLAYGAFQAFRRDTLPTDTPPPSTRDSLLRATLTNALSPGPWIFWSVAAGPILVQAWNERPALGLSFLLGFYVALIGGLIALITLFATARRAEPRVARVLNGFAAVALLALGVFQLWRGIQGS